MHAQFPSPVSAFRCQIWFLIQLCIVEAGVKCCIFKQGDKAGVNSFPLWGYQQDEQFSGLAQWWSAIHLEKIGLTRESLGILAFHVPPFPVSFSFLPSLCIFSSASYFSPFLLLCSFAQAEICVTFSMMGKIMRSEGWIRTAGSSAFTYCLSLTILETNLAKIWSLVCCVEDSLLDPQASQYSDFHIVSLLVHQVWFLNFWKHRDFSVPEICPFFSEKNKTPWILICCVHIICQAVCAPLALSVLMFSFAASPKDLESSR